MISTGPRFIDLRALIVWVISITPARVQMKRRKQLGIIFRKEERKRRTNATRRTWTEDQNSSLLSLRVSDGVSSDGGDEVGVQLVGTRDGVEDLDRVGVESSTLVLRLESFKLLLRLTLSSLPSSSL